MSVLTLVLASGGGGLLLPVVRTRGARPIMADELSGLPPLLAEWGCDAELWGGLRSKGRANLKKLAKNGDELQDW